MSNIALGGAFLGTGGGGDPYIGKLLAEQAIRENGPVDVLDIEHLSDDALVVPVAMMGAPTVMLEKLPGGDEAIAALDALQSLVGKQADAVFCIEAGGLNSTIPIAVAASARLPVIDGDAMGRAFPELQMVSMTLHDIAACPMVMADEKGNSIILNTVDNLSTEKFARVITVEMGGAGLIALYPMTGAQAKQATLRQSLSLINNIGSIIHTEQAANRNPVQLLADELDGQALFEGRVLDVVRRTEGGFARGSCELTGLGEDQGRTLRLEFQNEFLIALASDEKPLAMTPDLICLLDLETGLPITTEQIRYGFRVIVFALPCNKQWRTDADRWGQDYLANNSAGAGAYSLGSWDRGATMTIKKFDDYHLGWSDQPVDEVHFIVTNEEATVKALAASGKLSMSSDAQAQETYDSIGKMDGYRIISYPTATNFYLKLNHQVAPTDDVNIRKAIALATDYNTIRSALLPGEPLAGPMPKVFAGAYLDDLQDPVYDLAKAKEHVAQSKYADSSAIPVEIMFVAGLAFEEEIALLMKSNLDQIGFDTILKPEPWNRMTELASSPETTPAINEVFYGATYPSPDSYFFTQYHSRAKGTWSSMEWVLDDELDALIDKARGTGDVDEQNEIYKTIQRKLVEQQSDVYLLTQTSQQAFSDCLDGFTWVPMQSFEFNFHTMKWVCE